jgi:hypothetical protein
MRLDRSLHDRLKSLRDASQLHFLRTGRRLEITEEHLRPFRHLLEQEEQNAITTEPAPPPQTQSVSGQLQDPTGNVLDDGQASDEAASSP